VFSRVFSTRQRIDPTNLHVRNKMSTRTAPSLIHISPSFMSIIRNHFSFDTRTRFSCNRYNVRLDMCFELESLSRFLRYRCDIDQVVHFTTMPIHFFRNGHGEKRVFQQLLQNCTMRSLIYTYHSPCIKRDVSTCTYRRQTSSFFLSFSLSRCRYFLFRR